MSVSQLSVSGCTVIFEYAIHVSDSRFSLGGPKVKVTKFTQAEIMVLEEEKILQITDGRTKSALPIRFSLTKFVLYNARIGQGKLGLKFLESRTNLREVLVLMNSPDFELIKEINQGILSSQDSRGRVRGTPIASPTKNSPFVKKTKPDEHPTGRFGFGTTCTPKKTFSSIRQIRSPQLNLDPVFPELSLEQSLVLESVLRGESVFFTGGGGTGKSFLIKKLISLLPAPTTATTASTGVAACHIGGTTLHQFLGLGREKNDTVSVIVGRIRRSPDRIELIRKTKVLIIDEISLVDSKLFELTHEILVQVRGVSKPFGGIQLVLSGDFLQLPPVGDEAKFCFQSKLWRKFKSVQLTQIFRQNTDNSFATMLNEIRLGICSEATAKLLLTRCVNTTIVEGINLVPLNKQVVAINECALAKLLGAAGQTFTAIDTNFADVSIDVLCPVKATVSLTVGAQVMLVATLSIGDKLVNGSIGTLVRFGTSSGPFVKFPHIEAPVCVNTHEWVFKQAGKEVARRRQIPLVLAWAVSIHKSQGMTLDNCQVSLQNIFEAGQAYVALSRCTTLQGLSLVAPLSVGSIQKAVRANPVCLAFYKTLIAV